MILILVLSFSCFDSTSITVDLSATTDCTGAKNTCTDYAPYWQSSCPDGSRCIAFTNLCTETVALSYQVGCNGDGTPGAPQCDCTSGVKLTNGGHVFWEIVDGNYTSCLPSWQPPCLTSGLAVLANFESQSCATGTRIEFTAGNSADPYGHFDSYNLDVEKDWYKVPVRFKPDLTCANDNSNHDCRPLYCNSKDCPDAYQTPTAGGCSDNRSPQANCQDTFSNPDGYTVTFCPWNCKADGSCPSCQDAKACPT